MLLRNGKKRKVIRSIFASLKIEQTAYLIAAFLVYYESSREQQYIELKRAVGQVFYNNGIAGPLLELANEELKLLQDVIATSMNVIDDQVRRNCVLMRLCDFFQEVEVEA